MANDQIRLIDQAFEMQRRTMYFGDDPIKDGMLAFNARVPFGWFNPENASSTELANRASEDSWKNQVITFNDWTVLAKNLAKSEVRSMLLAGRSMQEVIAQFTKGER